MPTHVSHRVYLSLVCNAEMKISYFDRQKGTLVTVDGTAQGKSFEINNNFLIKYNNTSEEPCILLAIDWALREFEHRKIPKGATCYRNGKNYIGLKCEERQDSEEGTFFFLMYIV